MHRRGLSQPSLRTFTPRALFPRRSSVSFSFPAYRIGSSMGRSPLVELTPTGTPAKLHTRMLLWLHDQCGLTAIVLSSITTTEKASKYFGINASITYGAAPILGNNAGIVDPGATWILMVTGA